MIIYDCAVAMRNSFQGCPYRVDQQVAHQVRAADVETWTNLAYALCWLLFVGFGECWWLIGDRVLSLNMTVMHFMKVLRDSRNFLQHSRKSI